MNHYAIGFILAVVTAESAPCVGSEPAKTDDGFLKLTAHSDVVAAGQCLKSGRDYMLRVGENTVICMRYPLAHPEYESRYPIQLCAAVIQAAVEHVERIREANH